MGFGVEGFGSKVWVQDLGLRVKGLGRRTAVGVRIVGREKREREAES